MDILTQSYWLNHNVTTNKAFLYWKSWQDLGITEIKDILNEQNLYLTHEELTNKYNIKTTFLVTVNIQKRISTDYIKTFKNTSIKDTIEHNYLIFINNKLDNLKRKCNVFYWHILKSNIKIPRDVYQWHKIVQH